MDDAGFRPTHVAPREGLPTWSAPDPAQPAQWLDPLLPVRVVAREGDWARVLCANGWTAWVDGRLLVALPDGTSSAPSSSSSAPAPLISPSPPGSSS